MSALKTERKVHGELLTRLGTARARTDELFDLVRPEAFFARPIPERHRIAFYIGHLEAFDWNLIGKHGLGADPIHPEFDRLFAFGIDPVDGRLPDDRPSDWPLLPTIREYSCGVRQEIDQTLERISFSDPQIPLLQDGYLLEVAIEHRLMHAETLAYMLHQLPLSQKEVPRRLPLHAARKPIVPGMAEIPGGPVTLGRRRDSSGLFGWDNEFELLEIEIPRFRMDTHNVTNGLFLKFVESGGYVNRFYWSNEDWAWICRTGVQHPYFWIKTGRGWFYRSMFEEIPLPMDWPVYVSHAEASAYTRWKGMSLPSEAQWHRAASPPRVRKDFPSPRGSGRRIALRGNFDFQRWDPVPVGSYGCGSNPFGVADLVGNGWEWTSTIFGPLPGFKPFAFYPGYSADFFDGKHFVLKGGSSRTASCLIRKSFRNWFQPHYPYVYATFRCVEN